MAKFAKVNGDFLPVMNDDTGQYVNSGPNAIASGQTVQVQGPFLQFFTVTGTGPLSGTQVGYAIKAAEQLSTVHIYEYTNAANDTLALALYPADGWTTANLTANINAALTAGNVANTVTVTSGATFSAYLYPPTGPTAPAAPVISTAVATAATTATVNFIPQYNGGSAITGFNAVSVPAGGTGTAAASATSIAITGLTTGTAYQFYVTATNAIGTSAPSDLSNQVTTP
jgi:hypothetical protein